MIEYTKPKGEEHKPVCLGCAVLKAEIAMLHDAVHRTVGCKDRGELEMMISVIKDLTETSAEARISLGLMKALNASSWMRD